MAKNVYHNSSQDLDGTEKTETVMGVTKNSNLKSVFSLFSLVFGIITEKAKGPDLSTPQDSVLTFN